MNNAVGNYRWGTASQGPENLARNCAGSFWLSFTGVEAANLDRNRELAFRSTFSGARRTPALRVHNLTWIGGPAVR